MNWITNTLLSAALLAGVARNAAAQDPSLGFALVEAAAADASGVQDGATSPSLREQYFPTPATGLTLPAGDLTIAQLLQQFAEVTGETLTWNQDVVALMGSITVPLQRELVIAPESVYSVVQDLLRTSRFLLISLRREEPRMFAVASLDSPARASVRQTALLLPYSEVAAFAQDSAQLFQTVVPMRHADLDGIGGALRQLVVDPSVTQLTTFHEQGQIVVTADGRRLAFLVNILKAIDERSRQLATGGSLDPRAPKEQALRARLHPTPASGLTLRAGDQTLAELLNELSGATGEHLLWSEDSSALLKYTAHHGFGDLQLAPERVWAVVQNVLVANRFVLLPIRQEEPRLSMVASLDSPMRASLRLSAVFVPHAAVHPFAEDAATLISTVVSLEHVESIGGVARQMVIDPNTLQIVPLGSTRQVIVTGLGAEAVRFVEVLETLDAEYGVQLEARRAAEAAARANEVLADDAEPAEAEEAE